VTDVLSAAEPDWFEAAVVEAHQECRDVWMEQGVMGSGSISAPLWRRILEHAEPGECREGSEDGQQFILIRVKAAAA
jgi:hypothetical protein